MRRNFLPAALVSLAKPLSAGVLCLLAGHFLAPAALRGQVLCGTLWAVGVSLASLTILRAARGERLKTFLWAYSAGVVLRFGVLAVLMASVWGRPWPAQAARLGAYAACAALLLLAESRQALGSAA